MRRPSAATHSELEAAWVASAKPFVRAITVARVVESLISGEIGPIEVQMWAALLKHGYLGRSGAPIRPVDFPYEPEFEEEISRSSLCSSSSAIWLTAKLIHRSSGP